jgi:hypothetical protein
MKKKSNYTIGIDLGGRKHQVCVLGRDGEVVEGKTIGSDRDALRTLARRFPGAELYKELYGSDPLQVDLPSALRAIRANTGLLTRRVTGIGRLNQERHPLSPEQRMGALDHVRGGPGSSGVPAYLVRERVEMPRSRSCSSTAPQTCSSR